MNLDWYVKIASLVLGYVTYVTYVTQDSSQVRTQVLLQSTPQSSGPLTGDTL